MLLLVLQAGNKNNIGRQNKSRMLLFNFLLNLASPVFNNFCSQSHYFGMIIRYYRYVHIKYKYI